MQPDEDKVDDAVWAALFHARPQRSGMERVRLVRPESAAFPAAQLRDVLLAAQSFQHNADLLFGRILLPRRPANVADKLLGRTSSGNGFLPHLRSLAATMSQKSSVPQAAKFVSQALKRDIQPLNPKFGIVKNIATEYSRVTMSSGAKLGVPSSLASMSRGRGGS
jgi:hypothetical protein